MADIIETSCDIPLDCPEEFRSGLYVSIEGWKRIMTTTIGTVSDGAV
jgi:hypothetical protein